MGAESLPSLDRLGTSARPATTSFVNIGGTSLGFPSEFGRRVGVHTTPSQTAEKLGLFSSYRQGDAGSSRLIGSYGYTSAFYNPGLVPATAPRAYDSSLFASGRRLRPEDLDYLMENGRKNAEVFDGWRKQKEQQLRQVKVAKAKRTEQELRSFVKKEERIRQEAEAKFKDWATRKNVQAEVETLRRIDQAQSRRFTQAQQRMKDTQYWEKANKREGSFNLRLDTTVLPKSFDATLPPAASPRAATAAVERTMKELASAVFARMRQDAAGVEVGGAYLAGHQQQQHRPGVSPRVPMHDPQQQQQQQHQGRPPQEQQQQQQQQGQPPQQQQQPVASSSARGGSAERLRQHQPPPQHQPALAAADNRPATRQGSGMSASTSQSFADIGGLGMDASFAFVTPREPALPVIAEESQAASMDADVEEEEEEEEEGRSSSARGGGSHSGPDSADGAGGESGEGAGLEVHRVPVSSRDGRMSAGGASQQQPSDTDGIGEGGEEEVAEPVEE